MSNARPLIFAALISFGLGAATVRLMGGATRPAAPDAAGGADGLELRGPPTRAELGAATWTLLHTLAANFPDAPTVEKQQRARMLLHALGDLYPCGECAAHFRRHMSRAPVTAHSREALSQWMCEAHNKVNRHQGKRLFLCDLGVLDSRWKDCGCGHTNQTEEHTPPTQPEG